MTRSSCGSPQVSTWPPPPSARPSGSLIQERDLQPSAGPACVIEFLRAPAGVLAGVSGPPEATFYHPPGHVYGPLRVATDRAGYVICTAPTREEALAQARTAAEAVSFEVT